MRTRRFHYLITVPRGLLGWVAAGGADPLVPAVDVGVVAGVEGDADVDPCGPASCSASKSTRDSRRRDRAELVGPGLREIA